MHRRLGFSLEEIAVLLDEPSPGLAQYVRDAIHANADRAARAAGTLT